jgi:UPF0716 protein FxsA
VGKWLFLLFTVVPVTEVWLLVQLGGLLGPWPTVALVVVTGLVGAALARAEGTRVWRDWQSAMTLGRLPKDGVASGLLVLVGGVLLVTPGVLTDVVGFSLLLPFTRRPLAAWMKKKLEARIAEQMAAGNVVVQTGFSGGAPFAGGASAERPVSSREPDVIDMPSR